MRKIRKKKSSLDSRIDDVLNQTIRILKVKDSRVKSAIKKNWLTYTYKDEEFKITNVDLSKLDLKYIGISVSDLDIISKALKAYSSINDSIKFLEMINRNDYEWYNVYYESVKTEVDRYLLHKDFVNSIDHSLIEVENCLKSIQLSPIFNNKSWITKYIDNPYQYSSRSKLLKASELRELLEFMATTLNILKNLNPKKSINLDQIFNDIFLTVNSDLLSKLLSIDASCLKANYPIVGLSDLFHLVYEFLFEFSTKSYHDFRSKCGFIFDTKVPLLPRVKFSNYIGLPPKYLKKLNTQIDENYRRQEQYSLLRDKFRTRLIFFLKINKKVKNSDDFIFRRDNNNSLLLRQNKPHVNLIQIFDNYIKITFNGIEEIYEKLQGFKYLIVLIENIGKKLSPFELSSEINKPQPELDVNHISGQSKFYTIFPKLSAQSDNIMDNKSIKNAQKEIKKLNQETENNSNKLEKSETNIQIDSINKIIKEATFKGKPKAFNNLNKKIYNNLSKNFNKILDEKITDQNLKKYLQENVVIRPTQCFFNGKKSDWRIIGNI